MVRVDYTIIGLWLHVLKRRARVGSIYKAGLGGSFSNSELIFLENSSLVFDEKGKKKITGLVEGCLKLKHDISWWSDGRAF